MWCHLLTSPILGRHDVSKSLNGCKKPAHKYNLEKGLYLSKMYIFVVQKLIPECAFSPPSTETLPVITNGDKETAGPVTASSNDS